MRTMTLTLAFLFFGAALAVANEICGNPCEEGYVWTDKDMGKCIPVPEKPTS